MKISLANIKVELSHISINFTGQGKLPNLLLIEKIRLLKSLHEVHFVPRGGRCGTGCVGVVHSDLQVSIPANSITGLQHLPLAAFFKWSKFQFGLNPNSASNLFL